jgi:nucleoside-diphosphate-sugar epimerase
MKIVVIGGTGRIGSKVVARCAAPIVMCRPPHRILDAALDAPRNEHR